jgi:hypothetical protein
MLYRKPGHHGLLDPASRVDERGQLLGNEREADGLRVDQRIEGAAIGDVEADASQACDLDRLVAQVNEILK